jgi:hypothetical protein
MPYEKGEIVENKKSPHVSIAKALGIVIAVFLLFFAAFFMWSAHNHINSKAIDAELLDTVPDEFVIVTEEKLNDYPALKEAIDTRSYVKANPQEWSKTIDFLNEKGSSVVKFGDKYYEIGFITA